MVRRQVALAKLSWPRLHDVLARKRLFGVLDEALHRPVAWLCAQPGAGKTTLVASYASARKRGGIWYQLDAADADPASFVYHLNLAIDASSRRGRTAALPLLTPEYLEDIDGFARRHFRLLFERLPTGSLVVLDGLHEVPEESPLHRLLAVGMGETPPGLNIVVTSRAEPPARYAPLMAGEAIGLIGGDALRLTPDETLMLARQRGVDDATQARALHERCHGWAAGLTLLLARSAQAPAGEDDPQALQHVFGYFAQRVFDEAPVAQKQALMTLSFVQQFDGDVAQRLTGLPDAVRLLDHYHRRHLFIERRRVATGVVYQFHALFRSFLQHQAQAAWGPAGCASAAARGALALDAAGQWESALALHADAGAWDAHARSLLAHAEDLLEQGRHPWLLDVLSRVPPAERVARPWLAYWEGRALMATGWPQA